MSLPTHWRKGLARFLIVINVAVLAYFAYSAYASYGCQRDMQGHAEYWYKEIPKGTAGGSNPRTEFHRAAQIRDTCQQDLNRALKVLIWFPIGSALLFVAGLWVAAGFAGKDAS